MGFDRYQDHEYTFAAPMLQAPCQQPLACCASVLCVPCFQYYLRRRLLRGDMEKYECCTGSCRGFMCYEGSIFCEDRAPELCLFLESSLCPCCALGYTRSALMRQERLQSDPCDRRLIRLGNAVALCNCISVWLNCARSGAHCLHTCAECCYCCTFRKYNVSLGEKELVIDNRVCLTSR